MSTVSLARTERPASGDVHGWLQVRGHVLETPLTMDADDGCAMRQQFTAHGLVEVSARNVELPIRASLSPLEPVEREVITGNAIGDPVRSSFNTASSRRRTSAPSPTTIARWANRRNFYAPSVSP